MPIHDDVDTGKKSLRNHVVCHASYMLRAKFGCNGKIVGGGILHIAHVLFKMLSNGALLFF